MNCEIIKMMIVIVLSFIVSVILLTFIASAWVKTKKTKEKKEWFYNLKNQKDEIY